MPMTKQVPEKFGTKLHVACQMRRKLFIGANCWYVCHWHYTRPTRECHFE